jgi:hypothetical protein
MTNNWHLQDGKTPGSQRLRVGTTRHALSEGEGTP